MWRNRKLLAILMVTTMLMAILVLAGCGDSTADSETPVEEPTEHTVTDMAGRTVTVPTEINKIANFGSVGVQNAFIELMGEGSKICHDMPARFTKNDNWKLQYEFAPQIKGAPLFEDANGEVLIEVVLENEPDVCFSMSKETIELLEENGLTTVYFEWNEVEDVKTAVTLMGEVLGKQDTAEDYIEYFDSKVAKARDLTKKLGEEDKKTVLYGSVTEFSQPHVIAEWWIPLAGGISVTDNERTEDKFTYTLEDILKWDPDVIVSTAEKQIEELETDSRFDNVTAVKNDEIYAIPTVAHVWGNRTVEQPLTVFWMMNKLYPELMTREDLSEEIQYFYAHFFKYEMSDEQIAEIIDGKK
ncbi:MAG: ABC transporter substrate-binding protein [Desulfitobacteriaceae bacterium]|nr:ABC transporter substrate-binding protein [Desulfitobacteriaceae bacterium]MDD4402576.1 ABC transporter substrate-binding protein [Desulfitobacteriaceae bacterium]